MGTLRRSSDLKGWREKDPKIIKRIIRSIIYCLYSGFETENFIPSVPREAFALYMHLTMAVPAAFFAIAFRNKVLSIDQKTQGFLSPKISNYCIDQNE